MTRPPDATAPLRAEAFAGTAFRVIAGANMGDTLETDEGLSPGDRYRLASGTQPLVLRVQQDADGKVRVAGGSEVGQAGAVARVAAHLRFIADTGVEAAGLLIAFNGLEKPAPACLLPLHGVRPGQDMTLIGIDTGGSAGTLRDLPRADMRALGVARDTRVSRSDGALVPVQDLTAGDRLLTRDSGALPLLFIHARTVPATGPETPVVIAPGRLGNPAPLVLAPYQRIFFYQQGATRLADGAELLVRARALAGSRGIARRPGGYVEYFVLGLATHEVLYTEGVPCESLEVTDATRALLPSALTGQLTTDMPDLRHAPHHAQEADDAMAAAMARALLVG